MIDREFTTMLQTWLNQPREERDVEQGATYLLQLTRNRHLFAFCTSGKPSAMDKLEYELNKHLLIRLNGHTMDDVLRMSNTLMPAVAAMVERGDKAEAEATEEALPHPEALYVGKRADHDALPEEVRALYEDNFDRYVRIKELYNHLLALEQAEPCDRYEYLQQLAEQDRAYREAWAAYDSYNVAEEADEPAAETPEAPVPKAKRTKKAKAATDEADPVNAEEA